LQMN